ncbi:MAG: efflux RND transporter periplasmic adaptor subunit [bacterium]
MKKLLPFLVIAAGLLAMFALVKSRKAPEKHAAEVPPPLVRVLEVHSENRRLDVASTGEVAPRTETDLVAEVGGRVIEVSPSLAAGGAFEAGDVLARLDPRDYRVAVAAAKATLAQAEVALALQQSEADIARRDWESLGHGSEPDPLVLREPQLAQAQAAVESARALLDKARLDLSRTEIRAPYRGRVRSRAVDVGRFVPPGTPVARVWADDVAEVRLPIPPSEFAWLDLPLEGEPASGASRVRLRSATAGSNDEWTGSVVRVEGEIDRSTRMYHVIARVDDPYGRDSKAEAPPLPMGMFVEAVVEGRLERGVFALPRAAVHAGPSVLTVVDGALHTQPVEIVRTAGDETLVRGLTDGQQVCVSNLDLSVDGMKVRMETGTPERMARSETGSAGGAAPATAPGAVEVNP